MDLSSGHLRTLLAAAREHLASPSGASPVRQVPGWVVRHAAFSSGSAEIWIWCEPSTAARETGGQIVLDVVEGRYLIEVFDAATGRCLSLESAQATPIVAGLACGGHAVLVRVRRT